MADTSEIKFSNLGELRASLRLNIEELGKHMKITRQSASQLEKGEAKSAKFVRDAFADLKAAIGDQYDVFEMQAEPETVDTFRIVYTKAKSKALFTPEDPTSLSIMIMDLNNRVRIAKRNGDDLLEQQERFLNELKETLISAYG